MQTATYKNKACEEQLHHWEELLAGEGLGSIEDFIQFDGLEQVDLKVIDEVNGINHAENTLAKLLSINSSLINNLTNDLPHGLPQEALEIFFARDELDESGSKPTLRTLGKKHNLSPERVRQILLQTENRIKYFPRNYEINETDEINEIHEAIIARLHALSDLQLLAQYHIVDTEGTVDVDLKNDGQQVRCVSVSAYIKKLGFGNNILVLSKKDPDLQIFGRDDIAIARAENKSGKKLSLIARKTDVDKFLLKTVKPRIETLIEKIPSMSIEVRRALESFSLSIANCASEEDLNSCRDVIARAIVRSNIDFHKYKTHLKGLGFLSFIEKHSSQK